MKLSRIPPILAIFAALVAGCFYPPVTAPPTDEQQQTIVPLPYDLAWDVVNKVIAENGFRIQAQDSNEGIIETVRRASAFTTPTAARSGASSACTPRSPR